MAEEKLTAKKKTGTTTKTSKTSKTSNIKSAEEKANSVRKKRVKASKQEQDNIPEVAPMTMHNEQSQEAKPLLPDGDKVNRAFGVQKATAPTGDSASGGGELFAELSRQMIAEQRAKRRWGVFFKLTTLAIVLFVIVSVSTTETGGFMVSGEMIDTPYSKPFVAVVNVKGLIADSADVDASAVIENLRNAMQNTNSKAVVLDINSPGGSPVQAASIYRELIRLREHNSEKPIYAVISDLGASGAYYIAAGADFIYADPSSIVGSIGVILSGFGFTGSMEKLGIERRLLTSGDNKALLDPFLPRDRAGENYMQELLDNVHRQFIDDVIRSRPQLAKQDKNTIFSGLIFDGRTALQLGLIDGLGDIYSVSRDEIGVEELIVIDSQSDEWIAWIERFASSFGSSFAAAISSVLNKSGSVQLH